MLQIETVQNWILSASWCCPYNFANNYVPLVLNKSNIWSDITLTPPPDLLNSTDYLLIYNSKHQYNSKLTSGPFAKKTKTKKNRTNS